jgi:hypothetical protein
MRPFSPQDSRAVYDLAKRPTALGARVKDAMSIIDEAVGKYGSVRRVRRGTPADVSVVMV